MRNYYLLLSLTALAVFSAPAADPKFTLPPENITIKPGPGSDALKAQCQLCHSLDYVTTQPPLSRAVWGATLTKMQQKYGAPLAADRMPVLIEYLTSNYGVPDKPAAPAK